MELSDKKGVQHVVMALAALGLKEVVICPGSRNAPLVISFNRHPAFNCTSIRDERSAAFFALGKAIELKQPVAILCTSGSAALNFAPAIAEAYYQRIPLIVLTADRPKEWTDQGDGQTINQTDIYRNYIRKSFEINGDATSENDLWYIGRCLSEGFNIAAYSDKGPVHFNIPVSEPLYGTSEADENKMPKVFREIPAEKHIPEKDIELLAKQFSECKKVMLLVGQHEPDEKLQTITEQLASFENVVVLTESTSNIHHSGFIENIDRCITHLNDKEAKSFMPDLLITAGGAVVSKRIKKLLRDASPKYHWNIHPYDSAMDIYQALTSAIALEPYNFFEQLLPNIQPTSSDYNLQWNKLKREKEQAHKQFCADVAYSDFKVFETVFKTIPSSTHLHLANSSVIRYAQLFDNSKIASTWSNRGTSGIDGSSSTAVGAAAASPDKDFVLITGDVAFHYDKNAFWTETPVENLKVIIINNGGGGIFRIIPGPDKIAEREIFIETIMATNAEHIAAHYGWNYLVVKDEQHLESTLKKFFAPSSKKTILEIFTDANQNPLVLEQYWKFLKEKK